MGGAVGVTQGALVVLEIRLFSRLIPRAGTEVLVARTALAAVVTNKAAAVQVGARVLVAGPVG